MLKPALIAAALLVAAPLQAAPRDDLLVTPAWLTANARDPNLVILYAGQKAEFDAKHIPGAVFAPLNELAPNVAGGLTAELPAPEDLRTRLQALGVSDRSRIIVYTGAETPYATRLLLTLDAAGLGARSSLLDGGLGAWERAGNPTTKELKAVTPGSLSPLKMKAVTVDAAFIQKEVKPPRYDIIDARAGVFYDGVQAGMGVGGVTAKGHLPGAKNIPFNTVVDASGKLKPADQLQAMFKAAGVERGDKVVVYCHIGYQATAVIYAARTLGIDAKLYDGSFQDWSTRKLPLELAAAK